MDVTAYILPSHFLYVNIPAEVLRTEVDKFFPVLAKNPIADSVVGMGHRYKAGHDLLLDIPSTIHEYGIKAGMKHAGHIILTDFPTKAGIPIPGFSQSGLGEFLSNTGIHRGWLQANISDAGLGILAISEGSSDIAMALNGSLHMGVGTFFDTFVEGSIEIGLGLSTQNPFMLVGGIENVLAGVVSTWKTVSVYVDPLDFLGSTGFSALLGFSISYGLAGNSLCKASSDAVRSGVIGSLFSLSAAFGFGALAGFTSFRLGQLLSEQHTKATNLLLSVNAWEYQLLLDEICKGNENVSHLLEKAQPVRMSADYSSSLSVKNNTLPDQSPSLNSKPICLSAMCATLDSNPQSLSVDDYNLETRGFVLNPDPQSLMKWYSNVRHD